MASTSTVGEPFGAVPALQVTNRFVPLPFQVDSIQTYEQCMLAMSDAEYYARGQSKFRGNDPLRAEYANWFHSFAHDSPATVTQVHGDTGNVVKTFDGGCKLLLSSRTSRDAWPIAREQLRDTVTRFHTGQPLVLPQGTPIVECSNAYPAPIAKPWQCTPKNTQW